MHCVLFKFNLALNSGLQFWKLLAFEFLLGILDISVFSICSFSRKWPSPRCAFAANVGCRGVDIFGTAAFSLNNTLQFLLLMH
jgi:hypothetical protein